MACCGFYCFSIIGRAVTVHYLLAVRYIDTLGEMVTGKDNKIIYMPYEATGVLSSIGGIKDLLTMTNK